jgi:hypothetical protein
MPGAGITKNENSPHPALSQRERDLLSPLSLSGRKDLLSPPSPRGGGIKGGLVFI